MLANIKILLGLTGTDKDALLNLLISQATNDVLNYCHLESLNTQLENIVVDLVVRKYNLLGTEGLESESYTGVSYHYDSEIPEAILNQLRAYRKVRVPKSDD